MKSPFCDKVPMEKWCIQKYGYIHRPWQVLAPYEQPDRYGHTNNEFKTFQESVEFVSRYV